MWPGARLCSVLKSPYITAQWDFIQFNSIDDNMKNDATVADIADNTDTHLSWLPSCSCIQSPQDCDINTDGTPS